MIRLEVEDYCQNCLDFEADVSKPDRIFASDHEVPLWTDTIIRCEYRKRCAGIKRFLENQSKNEVAG